MTRFAGHPRRTQADRAADSSRRLALAAVELIAERGYHGATAAQIGLRAGFSRELVRARFGGKEALIESLLHEGFESRVTQIPAELPGLRRLLAHLDAIAELAESDAVLLRAAFVLSFAAASGAAPLAPHVAGWFAQVESAVADALQTGQLDGSIRPDPPAVLTAENIAATSAGIAYAWTLDPERVDLLGRLRSWRAALVADLAGADPGGRGTESR